MRLIDANVLLYAIDPTAERHEPAKRVLDEALAGPQTVLFPWVSLLAFLRIATHPAVFSRPLSTAAATDTVDAWLAQPGAVVPQPDTRHLARLRTLLERTGRGGNLVNDAHLAALAQQFDAIVLTFDTDFGRFPEVRWEVPV